LVKKSLVEAKRFRVEELKWRLAALDEMKAGLENNIRELESTVERQRVKSGDSSIARLAMPNLERAIESRRQNIEKTRENLEQDRSSLEEQLTAAMQELHAAELAEEARRRRVVDGAAEMADLRRDQQWMRRHLRRHAVR